MSLTAEDKAWIASLQANTATKADLAGFATKADLAGLATKADLAGFATKTDLASAVAELKAFVKESIYDSETKLLTAFHEWASPVEQKLRSHREALRALDLQIEEIGSRVKKLEAGLDTRH